MKDTSNYNMIDPHKDKSLDEIPELHERIYSLVCRSQTKPLLKNGFVNVMGAIEMMAGLSYHHNNFAREYEGLIGWQPSYSILDHEVVAYFNRLGQFYYFSKSPFVKEAVTNYRIIIPTLIDYIIFRNKYSAHRSLDDPRNESPDELIAHSRALTSSFISISTPRPGIIPPTIPMSSADESGRIPSALMDAYFVEARAKMFHTYQTFDAKRNCHVTFTLQIEHPKIMAEAYALLERVILFV